MSEASRFRATVTVRVVSRIRTASVPGTAVRRMVPLGKLASMLTVAPSQEDVVLSRPGPRARHAGVASVQNFLFAHTPSVVVYDCR